MKTTLDIDPAYQAALQAAGLADFDAMMKVRGGAAVGWHSHRETLPIEIAVGGQPRRFYLKRVFKVPPKHAFWPLFRLRPGRSQPSLEWRILGELERAGIPAMRRVAFGERRRLGMPSSAFLLVEAVAMRYTLEHWFVPGFPKPAAVDKHRRDRLVYELGVLVGELHAAGFLWPDIHAKHVFAAPKDSLSGGWAWDFSLIDVERMVRRELSADQAAQMPDKAAFKQLRLLRKSISPMPLGRHDLRRFFAGYFQRHRKGGLDAFARRRAGEAFWRVSKQACATDADFCPRLPESYAHPRCAGVVHVGDILVDPRAMNVLADAGLRRLQDVIDCRLGESLRKPGLEDHRERIRLELPDANGSRRIFFLKRYVRPPLRAQLRRLRRGSWFRGTAWGEVHFAKDLLRLGIPAVHPIAFGQRMRGCWERASFAITAEVEGESLERLAMRAAADPVATPVWRDRVEIIRQLALIVRRLHENRLFHRDLYLCHVFLTRNASEEIVLQLIDLARMLKGPRNGRRWQVKDLASLHYSAPAGLVTRADRLRFLYYYQSGQARGEGIDRRLIGDILARAQRMASHDASRARRFERAQREA